MSCEDALPEKHAQIRALLDDGLRRRLAGEGLSDEAILAAHPDLMPELAEELRKLALIQQAAQLAHAGGSVTSNAPLGDTTRVARTAGSTVQSGDLMLPCRLGPVRLVGEIGRGGMGVVWLGRDELLGRDVAVKLLLNAVSGPDDPGFSRFLEGARAAAGIRHLGLTTLHYADLVDGVPYLVMDYVDGPTLAEVIRSTGPLSPDITLQVLCSVCDALGELHDRDLVHRDIKPANILVSNDGQVFVTDFGLACERTPAGSTSGTRRMAGTPAYMAPEMFEGVVSLRSDVYALGITAFEMLTGVRPFHGAPEALREKHRGEALPAEALRERSASPDLIAVLERATHKNAMFRYKSSRFFLRALEGAARSDPTRGHPADLAHLIIRCRASPHDAVADVPTRSTPSSYFDRISEIAAQKLSHRDLGREVPTQDQAVQRPHESEPKAGPSSTGQSPEPAVIVRENPLLEFFLRGTPEWALFESDLHRRLALTELPRTLKTLRAGARQPLSRLIRTRRFWLQVGVVGAGTLTIFAILKSVKPVLKPLGMPLPLEALLSFVMFMVVFGFSLLHNIRRHFRQPLRLKLLEQGVPVCLGCGYPLLGLPLESGRCPECGRPFDERVRELLSQASAELPGARSRPLMTDLHEMRAIKLRKQVRMVMLITGIAMMLAAAAAFTVATVYPPMQGWYWKALILGIGLLGFIIGLFGQHRYRISS